MVQRALRTPPARKNAGLGTKERVAGLAVFLPPRGHLSYVQGFVLIECKVEEK